MALADAWDAMSSDRPYRRGLAPARVRAEVERCSGSQFDPVLAKELLALFEAAEVEPELIAEVLAAAGPGASERRGVQRW